jgi:hypothetical protein
MFVVSLVEFSKRVQNEISAKVMPKPQNFTDDEGVTMSYVRASMHTAASRAGKSLFDAKLAERRANQTQLLHMAEVA